MKILVFVSNLILLTLHFTAQANADDQISIAFDISESSGNATSEQLAAIENTIHSTFNKDKRFLVTDVDNATNIVSLSISAFSIEEQQFRADNGKTLPYYECKLVGNITVKNIPNNTVLYTNMWRITGGKGVLIYGTYAKTGEVAFESTLASIESKIKKKLIKKVFPIEAKLVRVIETDKGGHPKRILIKSGINAGVKTKQKFDLYEIIIETFEGESIPRKNFIGTIKITEVSDDNFSEGKVTKGKAAIKKALAAGRAIVLKSQPK